MSQTVKIPADNIVQNVNISGRYVTILSCTGSIKIKAPNLETFEVDVADEIDFLEVNEGGLNLQITNSIAGKENLVTLASSPVPVIRKKRVELDTNTFVVDLAAGQKIHEIELPVKIEQKKNNVNFVNHTFNPTGDDIVYPVAGDKIIISAGAGVTVGGAKADGIILEKLLTPINLTFKGVAGETFTIIELTEV